MTNIQYAFLIVIFIQISAKDFWWDFFLVAIGSVLLTLADYFWPTRK